MSRYRLRFLLQEFDLPRGATVLGRSTDCHVTIEDPLVSRHHARIVLDGEHAFVYDLNSRNGVKVNGKVLKGPVELCSGDRLRLGTQELVFCRVEHASGHVALKTTGFLRHCARCRMPYPQEAGACPNCGATEALEEETLSGNLAPGAQQTWSTQLFLDVLERALALRRLDDVERLLRRFSSHFEEAASRGIAVDRRELAKFSEEALRASLEIGKSTWGVWVATFYEQMPFGVPPEVAEKMSDLATRFPAQLAGPVERLAGHSQTLPPPESSEALAALATMRAMLDILTSAKPVAP